MNFKGDDMAIKESGWYRKDILKCPMKQDENYKIFTREDIFETEFNIKLAEDLINEGIPPDLVLDEVFQDNKTIV